MPRYIAVVLPMLSMGCTTGLHAYNPNPPDDTGDADTDTDSDSDTDTDTDTDTGGNRAPALTSFDATDLSGDILILFSATDPDGNLSGGSLEITVDGNLTSFPIPNGLESWTGSSGTAVVSIAGSSGCGSSSHNVQGFVKDAQGLSSPTQSDSVTVGTGTGVEVTEVGDDGTTYSNLGSVTPPITICGNIYGGSNNGSEYTSDIDFMLFTVGTGGTWNFDLSWDTAGDDYDLALFDTLWQFVAYSETDGSFQPESMSALVFQGEQLYLRVGAWSGVGGDWTLEISQ